MQHTYAKGLYFNRLKPETPEAVKKWKKGSVSVHVENFTAQLSELKEHVNDKGYLRFDLVENEKDGEKFLSFRLDTWKPEKTEGKKPDYPLQDADVPF